MIRRFEDPLPGVEVAVGGASMRVLDQGAQVVDWVPAGGAPVLFASTAAVHLPGHHVRAGAPVVFPWFGQGVLGDQAPVHGYARLRAFRRLAVEAGTEAAVVRHSLEPDHPGDRPARLDATTTMTADSLSIALTATNLSAEQLRYEIGLHSYFAVGDVLRTSVLGLQGCQYLDRVSGAGPLTQGPSALTVQGELDRVFGHTGRVTVVDSDSGRSLRIDKSGSATTIVWNPGPEKARAFPDLADGEWRRLICIEAANVGEAAVLLAPGESHTLVQTVQPE